MSQTIYRIDKNGNGPFQSENWDDRSEFNDFYFSGKHCDYNFTHPTPREDGFDYELDDNEDVPYRCAAIDLKQLTWWFPHTCRSLLKKNGFKLIKIEVSECVVLGHQVMFKPENVVYTEVLDIEAN